MSYHKIQSDSLESVCTYYAHEMYCTKKEEEESISQQAFGGLTKKEEEVRAANAC